MIVARVETGELKPNVGYNKNLIALGNREPNVSWGNDIVVDETDEGTYAVPDSWPGHYFTGFRAAVRRRSQNSSSSRLSPSQLVRYDEGWYFVAN
jgi:hypothetical protein